MVDLIKGSLVFDCSDYEGVEQFVQHRFDEIRKVEPLEPLSWTRQPTVQGDRLSRFDS